jgi:hypothetical protein
MMIVVKICNSTSTIQTSPHHIPRLTPLYHPITHHASPTLSLTCAEPLRGRARKPPRCANCGQQYWSSAGTMRPWQCPEDANTSQVNTNQYEGAMSNKQVELCDQEHVCTHLSTRISVECYNSVCAANKIHQ